MAILLVSILATDRTQSLAVWLTECSSWQCKQNLLTQDIFQLQPTLFIIPDFCLFCGNRALRSCFVHSQRTKQQVELRRKSMAYRLDAARAGNLKHPGKLPSKPDIGNDLRWTAVFVKHLSSALCLKRTHQESLFAKIDRPLGQFQGEINGLPLQFHHRQSHRFFTPFHRSFSFANPNRSQTRPAYRLLSANSFDVDGLPGLSVTLHSFKLLP